MSSTVDVPHETDHHENNPIDHNDHKDTPPLDRHFAAATMAVVDDAAVSLPLTMPSASSEPQQAPPAR